MSRKYFRTTYDDIYIYLILYRKIRKRAGGRQIVPHNLVMEIFKRFIPFFPHNLYYPIIKNMEKFKLIKKIDRLKYELIGGTADNSLNKFNCPF